jgi:hypothetical protein
MNDGNRRILTIPESYNAVIESELRKLDRTLQNTTKLQTDILRLSDLYTGDPLARSPWQEPWAQAASLAYYFPLNYSRAKAVAMEAFRLGFFEGITHLVDFGSGMGSALLAFRDQLSGLSPALSFTAYDVSQIALKLGQELSRAESGVSPASHLTALESTSRPPPRLPPSKNLLVLASYVLTELNEPPEWWFDAEAVVIIEPSTQEDARRLMSLREEMIARGFSIWAPCTHHESCPLLHLSKKDWCHDRIHFATPGPWWDSLEAGLPIKNRTLTFSYLLARKSHRPPKNLGEYSRLTGDRLEEKGKNRQSICRGKRREFIAWFPGRMKTEAKEMDFARGQLLKLENALQEKGAENAVEIRISAPQQAVAIPPEVPLPTTTK